MPKKDSAITITDQFCGAGGSSLGASQVEGTRLRMALNHWKLAIETHNTNFPDADHDCADVSAVDPRRYPSTQILITSPECTNHSLAKGAKRKAHQPDLFQPAPDDPGAERSRATMWDVPRFAEFHDYEYVVVENVVDAQHWVMFPAWLKAMKLLGYDHKILYLNSMFFWPTPQSRDRMYVVFWKEGNHAPDLEFTPPAWCGRCTRDVEAVQSWKNGRTWGRYTRQYVYCCPGCAEEVTPYYFAALNAIDFTIPAERIRDRKRPLKPRTMDRVRDGFEQFGRQPLVVITNMTTDSGRVRGALRDALHTQTGSALAALVSPFLIPAGSNPGKPSGASEPMPTQTTSDRLAAVIPPSFLMTYRNYEGVGYPVRGLDQPMNTLVTSLQDRIIINGAALLSMRDWSGKTLARGLDSPLPTQVATSTQDWIISPAPFLVPYYSTGTPSGVDQPIPTLSTVDRHALIEPETEVDVEDCYFRMLQPPEIGRGMAFPDVYRVLGNKRDQVKQYGNAVTPPVMRWIIGRCKDALTGERYRKAA